MAAFGLSARLRSCAAASCSLDALVSSALGSCRHFSTVSLQQSCICAYTHNYIQVLLGMGFILVPWKLTPLQEIMVNLLAPKCIAGDYRHLQACRHREAVDQLDTCITRPGGAYKYYSHSLWRCSTFLQHRGKGLDIASGPDRLPNLYVPDLQTCKAILIGFNQLECLAEPALRTDVHRPHACDRAYRSTGLGQAPDQALLGGHHSAPCSPCSALRHVLL